jgi:hypothetical protein
LRISLGPLQNVPVDLNLFSAISSHHLASLMLQRPASVIMIASFVSLQAFPARQSNTLSNVSVHSCARWFAQMFSQRNQPV